MPIRLRVRAQTARDLSPVSARLDFVLPDIAPDDSFRQVVRKLSVFFTDVIELPSTFEQLRTTDAGSCLRELVDHLDDTCTNPAIVNALLALKWHYAADGEHQGLAETRSNACEIVAWRFLTRLSERQAVEYCLYEIPDAKEPIAQPSSPQQQQDIEVLYDRDARGDDEAAVDEEQPLLPRINSTHQDALANAQPVGGSAKKIQLLSALSRLTNLTDDASPIERRGEELDDQENGQSQRQNRKTDPAAAFVHLNALEIAAIANAKRFLSQHVVQKIVSGMWNGDIVFWDSLSVHSTKRPRFYNPRTSRDPFARLRVPKYLKSWEVLFFFAFLCLYYMVLLARDETRITKTEVALFVWIAAFAYDELSEWIDAGSVFYAADVWNLFDMAMIIIGFTFAALRIYGIAQNNEAVNALAFDVLALEALFMMPRICSVLSLSPYWGTLIPCLKEMGKDFLKFMVLVVIIYLGFLTTFSLVGRDVFDFYRMAGILTKIFFGSSYIGFEVMDQIDPLFGPPLMLIFVTLTSILLTGSMTGMLSNSFSRVITHAREEYLYVYSVYVLEATTSNRVTHFYPPFNLVALVIFRPWRLLLGKGVRFRAGRILLLKATHLPVVAAIKLYELIRHSGRDDDYAGFKGPRERGGRSSKAAQRRASAYSRQSLAAPLRSTHRRSGSHTAEDDVDDPSSMEGQIDELSRKIDQLTSVVLALQESQQLQLQQHDVSRSAPDS